MLKRADTQKNILIIDDDTSVTKMLSLLLETRGYHVSIAASAREALEKASYTIDLILLDLVLPDSEGFELCRRLKENRETRPIPIIILSAKLIQEDIVEGLYLGADDCLNKPFEYEELIARMEAVMRRAKLFRHNLASHGEEAIICELRKIVDEGLIVPFFQPIFCLNPFKLYGLEVLSRAQTQSMLANPELLFKAAIQFGFYQDLEILAWKKALEYVSPLLSSEKLFLNCNPFLVEGAKFLRVKSIFEQLNVKVENVILEITERSAINDFKAFYEHLRYYRDYGFKFAVDDVGGGYASLESIVETKPEVIKIDPHIVHDLENDPFKQSIIRFVVAFCKENKILSVAEGIETKKDLENIRRLGIDAVQGYYLYRPTQQVNIEKINSISLP